MSSRLEPNPTSPKSILWRTFHSHPDSIGEGYFEHMRAALGYSATLTVAAAAALLHALVPCLCQTTARNRIESLHDKLQKRVPISGTTKD